MSNEEMNKEEFNSSKEENEKQVGKCSQQLTALARALWFCKQCQSASVPLIFTPT
jgi:hypothetical protein